MMHRQCDCRLNSRFDHTPACELATAIREEVDLRCVLEDAIRGYRKWSVNLADQVERFTASDDFTIGWRCTEDAIHMEAEARMRLESARRAWMMAVSQIAALRATSG